MQRRSFNASSFLIRWIGALVLVFATYNPFDFSFYHWVTATGGEGLPLKILAGIVLVILYVVYLRATWRSLGPIGLILALAFFGSLIWVLVWFKVIATTQSTVITFIVLAILATIMAIGLSWSHVRRRLSGQADMDDVDE